MFITSDIHFGHRNIIDYCKRPFSNVEEMNETIISNWNSIISLKSIVYVLGDFSLQLSLEENELLLSRLNGKKILIKGNHDHKETTKCKGWYDVYDYKKIKLCGYKFILMHYPILSWDGSNKLNSIMLHGHCHGTLSNDIYNMIPWPIFDVGMDVWNFKPMIIEEFIPLSLKKLLSKQKSIDHHI